MDLACSCRAFVCVSEVGSFTQGAAAADVPQPVASRRIAALERHPGERLFDRSTRRANPTPFGRDMLPWARRLVQLADAMEQDAQRARLRPLLRQRLAPDFGSDASTWSSKTGTLLNLRHEVGVVEHADGRAFAIAALTESRVPATTRPEADVLMARVARVLRDHLRHA